MALRCGSEKVYGWVYSKCLMPRGESADSCTGKPDGYYCSVASPNKGYRCAGGAITELSCESGATCVRATADNSALQCRQ